jgi:hypothetical protein
MSMSEIVRFDIFQTRAGPRQGFAPPLAAALPVFGGADIFPPTKACPGFNIAFPPIEPEPAMGALGPRAVPRLVLRTTTDCCCARAGTID